MPSLVRSNCLVLLGALLLSMAPDALAAPPDDTLRELMAGAWAHVERDDQLHFLDARCVRFRDGRQTLNTVRYADDGARLSSMWPATPIPGTLTIEDDVLTIRYPVGDRVDRYERLGSVPPALQLEPYSLGTRSTDADEIEALAKEFEQRMRRDQAPRLRVEELEQQARAEGRLSTAEGAQAFFKSPEMQAVGEEMSAIDRDNTARLIELIQDVGWPSPEHFGKATFQSAFFIVQHSGHLRLMITALPLIEDEAQRDPSVGQEYALLYDRLQLNLGSPQRYGTQLTRRPDGTLAFENLELKGVDERRRALGMTTLEAYIALFESTGSTVERPVSRTQPSGRPWPLVVADEAFADQAQAGYLAAVLGLLERENEARADPGSLTTYLDTLGTYLALVGEQALATKVGDEAFGASGTRTTRPDGPDPLAGYRPRPALETLLQAAAERPLVMVNEEHRSSMQRAFSNQLIEPLRAAGFGYLAVEALREDEHALRERGYPLLTSGSYLRDPAFGDLIRRALALGFVVFGYDATPEQSRSEPDDSYVERMNRRERAQAENIFERTFAQHPDARVFVIAGRDHIAESAGPEWTPMGGVLAELSGIDPLTVNQFSLAEHSAREFEHWAFRHAVDAGWTAEGPTLLADDEGALWSAQPGALDASLIHSRTELRDGRPHWLGMGGLRAPYVVPDLDFDRPVLLQAHLAHESGQAVPVDQVVLWPGRPTPALLLRPGSYRVTVVDRVGLELFRGEHSVDRDSLRGPGR